MTHPGGRWDRELRDIMAVRVAAAVRILGHAKVQTLGIIELEDEADAALRAYPCHGCGMERVCTLAYVPENEGRPIEACEREVRE